MNLLIWKNRTDGGMGGWRIVLDQRAGNTGPSKGSSIGGEAREEGGTTTQLGIKCKSVGIGMGIDNGCRLRTYIYSCLQLMIFEITDTFIFPSWGIPGTVKSRPLS